MASHEFAPVGAYDAAEAARLALIEADVELRVIDRDSYQSIDSSYFRVTDSQGRMFYVRLSPAPSDEADAR